MSKIKYNEDLKIYMIRLVHDKGIPINIISNEFAISDQTLRKWTSTESEKLYYKKLIIDDLENQIKEIQSRISILEEIMDMLQSNKFC